jgi:hypothetical protein
MQLSLLFPDMNVVHKVRKSFFPSWPAGRRRRERRQLVVGILFGLIAALLAAGAIYLLQDRLMR